MSKITRISQNYAGDAKSVEIETEDYVINIRLTCDPFYSGDIFVKGIETAAFSLIGKELKDVKVDDVVVMDYECGGVVDSVLAAKVVITTDCSEKKITFINSGIEDRSVSLEISGGNVEPKKIAMY